MTSPELKINRISPAAARQNQSAALLLDVRAPAEFEQAHISGSVLHPLSHLNPMEVEKLAAAEGKFSETMLPVEALRAWMLLFVDHIAAKQIIAPALNSVVGGPSKLFEGSRSLIQGAIDALVMRAIKSGDIRSDLDPFDLLRALIGVSHVASGPGWQQSARRLVDILITGSRPVNRAASRRPGQAKSEGDRAV